MTDRQPSSTDYETWVWLVREPDGSEGPVAAIIPGMESLGLMVLMHPHRDLVEQFRDIAEAHGNVTGHPIRLATLSRTGTPMLPIQGADREH